jgi:hypothetical protein
MKFKCIIEKINVNGYERFIYLNAININRNIWCNLIEHEEYLEGNEISKVLKVGQKIDIEIGIDMVNDYTFVESLVNQELLQPINESPHSIVFATVREVIDEFTLKCDVEGLGKDIIVEFEQWVNILIGSNIKLTGNLKGEVLK